MRSKKLTGHDHPDPVLVVLIIAIIVLVAAHQLFGETGSGPRRASEAKKEKY